MVNVQVPVSAAFDASHAKLFINRQTQGKSDVARPWVYAGVPNSVWRVFMLHGWWLSNLRVEAA